MQRLLLLVSRFPSASSPDYRYIAGGTKNQQSRNARALQRCIMYKHCIMHAGAGIRPGYSGSRTLEMLLGALYVRSVLCVLVRCPVCGVVASARLMGAIGLGEAFVIFVNSSGGVGFLAIYD